MAGQSDNAFESHTILNRKYSVHLVAWDNGRGGFDGRAIGTDVDVVNRPTAPDAIQELRVRLRKRIRTHHENPSTRVRDFPFSVNLVGTEHFDNEGRPVDMSGEPIREDYRHG